MKIALVHPPILQHTIRGTGSYMRNLLTGLRSFTDVEVVTCETSDLPEMVDIYHFPYFDPFFLTLPWIRKKKTIVTVHDLIPIKFPQHFPAGIRGTIKWKIQKQALKKVSAIITDSNASRRDIIELLGIKKEKTHTIYLAAEEIFSKKRSVAQKTELRQKMNLPEKFALYVGETNWNKNLPNIIRAAIKSKTRLLVVSKSFRERHDAYHPWKESLLEAQSLSKNSPYILPVGFTDGEDLTTLYQMSIALLMPSFYEGFGLPVVEAMASGCPVIASDKGSLAEVCGKATLIVDPNNVSSISEALNKLQKDSFLRTDLIKKGLIRIKEFSWKKTVEATVEVYKQVLEN